jgi:exopolyphosphatase/guanosine-5'-triphosphate,3'-diphosphate pyrophosphatase
MRASIDIGSNSIILLIADVENGVLKEVLNESRVTGLGKGIDVTGELNPESIKDSLQALSEYVEILKKYKVDPKETIVTATEALRSVKNKDSFLSSAKGLGLHINLITAEAEAYYTAKGVSLSPNLLGKDFVIMDIGGASTELIKVHNDPFHIKETISLRCGSVRGNDWLAEGRFDSKMSEILSHPEINRYETAHLICVAGSMTSLGGMALGLKNFDDKKINGQVIKFENFLKFVDRLDNETPEKLLESFPFLGKRAKTIVAGAKVATLIAQKVKVETFEISTYGLRHGVCLEGKIDEKFLF